MRFAHASMREARARFADLLDDAERGTITFVTRHGRTAAAIAPAPLLEQLGQALNVLAADAQGADIVLTAEDGSMVLMQVKSYSGGPGQDDQSMDADSARPRPMATGEALVVTGPPGAGKSTLMRRIISEVMAEGEGRVLIFDAHGGYVRAAVDAGTGDDAQPEEELAPQSPGAGTG